MASSVLVGRQVKYLSEFGFEVSERPAKGYKIESYYLPTNSVKEVIVTKVEGDVEKEIARVSSLDNVIDLVKAFEGYPQKLVEVILQILK
ncbi:MAG: hypothetical protein K1T65_03390 [Candidatus Aramenus sp.]|nr:hypothetical protein [Candidatus Aramenus sp.]